MVVTPNQSTGIHWLTDDEAWEVLEEHARARLGISAREFIANWQSGAYGDDPDDNPDALALAMLLPMVGVDPWQNDG